MSIDSETFLIFGCDAGYEHVKNLRNEHDDIITPYIEGNPKLSITCIFDGMCGEYAFVGKILNKDKDLQEITLPTDEEKKEIEKEIRQVFNVTKPLGLFLVKHYS